MKIINGVEPLRVGDYARCLVTLKKPGKWGTKSIITRNVTVTGIAGDFIQVKVAGRIGPVAIKRADIQSFWRYEEEPMTDCHACGYRYEESLGRYGCPNCHAEGLE
jgi:tRNA(Ile2) C34 agmatinyltransferase TiaS